MIIKKAILTGGGRGTRLYPITTTTNKHLLPLAGKPMIFHAIEKVVEAGVEEIFINTNPGDTVLPEFVGDGSRWGVKIKFFEQTGGPQGIAHVVNLAKDFIGDEPFIFYLSDNIILGSVKEFVDEYEAGGYDCMLALSKVPDNRALGVPVFDESGRLISVEEKPENPKSEFAVTGIYIYGPKVFFEAFKKIGKSARGEYEISDIHSQFLRDGLKVGYKEITGYWKDTGKKNDLIIANKLLLESMDQDEFKISEDAEVNSSAKLEGAIKIGKGTVVAQTVKIIGPVVIGENCILEDCVIGPDVTLENNVEVRRAKIKNSVIMAKARIDADMDFTESMIGKLVEILENKDGKEKKMIVGDKTVLEL